MNNQSTTFVVKELCCSTEESLIRKKLSGLEHVEIRGINILEKTVSINHACPKSSILNTLREAGFQAHVLHAQQEQTPFIHRHRSAFVLSASALLLILGLIRSMTIEYDLSMLFLFSGSILFSGWNVLRKGWKAITAVSLDMNFLMSVAAIGALVIGKWSEGAVVMFLFALSELLEQYSLKRSRNAIHSLMTSAPSVVNILRDNVLVQKDVRSVIMGETIVIRPGEQIPLDGIVLTGTSAVNQSLITGESIPATKIAGSTVFAGSFNGRGKLEVQVTALYDETMLARIVKIVGEAQTTRAPIYGVVERFAKKYTPIVFGIACAIAILPPLLFTGQGYTEWLYRALVLLVIACPCALVISTPVTIMSGIANAARHGVLIKGGKFLETLGSVRAFAFDKTGTLTKGTPLVTDTIPFDPITETELLRIAASVETHSEHHIAHAIKQKATEQGISVEPDSVHEFEALIGKGVRATIGSIQYTAGSHSLIEELNLCSHTVERELERLERQGKTTILVASEKIILGIIAVADAIRPEAAGVIRRLRETGVKKIIMLTGDNRTTASSIGEEAGIDEVHAQVLPHEKSKHVSQLKETYETIAMIGDGMNDAPALASATIGIAMGKTGTDVTLEAADIVLVSDELEKLPYAMRLSKQTLSIIKQNIALALGIKLAVLVLGMFGVATLWMAILADDGATLLVIVNGLRILRFK